jgi:hypothetical protein
LLVAFPTASPWTERGVTLTTKIEFYDRLREHLPEPAARLIAEETAVDTELVSREYFDVGVAKLRADLFRWMLVFFVPLWVGVYGTLVAILVRGT